MDLNYFDTAFICIGIYIFVFLYFSHSVVHFLEGVICTKEEAMFNICRMFMQK